jgi:rsbT co-antagonist protein RsbR
MGALRCAPLPVVEHDGDLRVTGWNDAAERVFGYSREEAVGRSVADLILGGDEGAWRRLVREGGGAPLTCTRKVGGDVRYAWRCEPILDEQGESAGAIAFGQDLPEEARVVELVHKERLLHAIMDNLPICMWAVDPQGTFTLHDGKGLATAGLKPGQLLGLNVFDLYGQEENEAMIALRGALEGEPGHSVSEAHGVHWENWVLPVRGERGEVTAVVGITLDISLNTKAERELRAQLDLVERQQRVIRELSTPIIEVWDKVLTLPMVGVIDSARTAEVMDSLLEAVVRARARFAILDLTGVEAVDTKTAAYLIELVRAIRLLGAEGIITGIRPTVAQTVVALGLDLGSIITLSNLRAGLRHCIAQMSREPRVTPPPRGDGAPAHAEGDPARARMQARMQEGARALGRRA